MAEYLSVCEKAARVGGKILLDKLGKVTVREKGPADLVTEADLAAQQAILDVIMEAFPGHGFVGEEEAPVHDEQGVDSEFRWIADPLDGTTNYAHGVPHFAVSLALEHRGELLAGVVYNPVSGECFTAAKGEGARLCGEPLRVSPVKTSSDALACVGFPPDVRPDSPDFKAFLKAILAFQAIRRTGSAALNLCYLASGRFDAAWAFSTKIWDVAAGVLMIREAGGIVTSPTGGDFVLDDACLLATATPELHGELLEIVTSAGIGPIG